MKIVKLKIRNFKKGMSLIEIIIYLAIAGIVLAVMIDLVTRIAENRSLSIGQGNVISEANFILDRLTYSIQSADTISGSYPGNTLTLTLNGTNITYSLANGRLYYQEGSAENQPLTDGSVELTPPNPGESLFNQISSGTKASYKINFKMRYKPSNFNRDFVSVVSPRKQ